MTKSDKIRRLVAAGWSTTEIANELGFDYNYVCTVRNRDRRPGWSATWMREKRAADPKYYRRELKQQRSRKRQRRTETGISP